MSQIKTIKAKVAPADAARHYELTVHQNGIALCPFHKDTHPSMKLYDDHFYCFACGAHGDVIDLTAKLLGLNLSEAVCRLVLDFGIGPNGNPPNGAALPKPYLFQARRNESRCLSVLTKYKNTLRRWKREYAPASPGRVPDDRFVVACQMLDLIEYLTDFLCASMPEEQEKFAQELVQSGLIDRLQRKGANCVGHAA